MADITTLFHNPDSLSEAQMSVIRAKIRMQRYSPYMAAVFGGSLMFVADTVFFKKAYCLKRIAPMAALGYGIGAMGTY